MKKKYYDAPQMEIVKLSTTTPFLADSMKVDGSQTITEGSQFLAPDLISDDSGEDW